jgi:two-component system CheB/CheR fusion protein
MREKKPWPPPSSPTRAKNTQKKSSVKKLPAAVKISSGTSPAQRKSMTHPSPEPPENHRLPIAKPLTIVGIGASAGGLEAFTQLLRSLPADTGMAFVLVQHLDPKHESMLTQILSQRTKMPVYEVKDGMAAEPDHVYIIPPNTDMTISGGVLALAPRTQVRGHHMPVDHFFHSLAEDQKSKAVGVILSGTASDGSLGLKAIKAEGGITFAQDEKSAKYGGMPHSAAAASAADFILPPEGIARELVRISLPPYLPTEDGALKNAGKAGDRILPNGNGLGGIFAILKSATGVDFTHYKQATPKRRILRRMALRRIENIKDYGRYLEDNPAEGEALCQDILIHVTGFFRDPETFAALADQVFPEMMKNRGPQRPVRVWVPGCSTGEEAYSLAIALVEFLGKKATNIPIQIFATDILDGAIHKARAGRYPENIASALSPERLERFFVRMDGGYQVSKSIREMCVFAKHDLTSDPPFSNLDLISCRNVLIYLGIELQRRAMAVFHYALQPAGFLLLGKSEAIGRFPDLFASVDRKYKIFSKKPSPARLALGLAPANHRLDKIDISPGKEDAGFDVTQESDRIVLSKYAPAGVIVNDRLEIIGFRGRTGLFLEHLPGDADLGLLKMAREGIQMALRMALQEAKKQGAPVRKEGLRIKLDGQLKEVNLEAIPLKAPRPGEGCFLILFEEAVAGRSGRPESRPLTPAKGKGKRQQTKMEREDPEVARLEQELEATRKHLQAIVEEHEAANEELRAANEEVLSANEELQSINEELETAKEELQSTNEELTTLNDELQNRNLALDQLNSDMINLFTSTNLPVLMLGNDLCLRRFTPMAEKRLNLTAGDIGRSILHLRLDINVPDLETLILEAIHTGTVQEKEIQDREGFWVSLQIRPYRTVENKIGGAVVTWVDIHTLKRSLEKVQESRDYAEAIVQTVRESLVILDKNLKIKTANRAFYQTFQTSPEETEDHLIYEVGNGQWDIPDFKKLLEDLLSQNASFQDFEMEHEFPAIGRKIMRLNARRIFQGDKGLQMILLAIEDVTEHKQLEEELRKSHDALELRVQERTAELARVNEELQVEIAEREKAEELLGQAQKMEAVGTLVGGIAHDFNNILAVIGINTDMALQDLSGESSIRKRLELIAKAEQHGRDLVRQMLLFSRKSEKRPEVLSLGLLLKENYQLLRASFPSTIGMKFLLETESDLVFADPTQVRQVIMNLCTNGAYAMRGAMGNLEISLKNISFGSADPLPDTEMSPGDYLVLSVKDTGSGMDEEVRRRIFEPFFTTKPAGEGTGLGLSVVYGIVKSHKGGIAVASEPGKGSTFEVFLPKSDKGLPVGAEGPETIARGSERVLFVDDDEMIVISVRNMLQRLGYTVTAIADSREALNLFSENPFQFDLVITDYTMPIVTGEALGKEMIRIRPDIPVILCTGYNDLLSSEMALAMGFRGFIMKPFTVREGSQLIRKVLDREQSK